MLCPARWPRHAAQPLSSFLLHERLPFSTILAMNDLLVVLWLLPRQN